MNKNESKKKRFLKRRKRIKNKIKSKEERLRLSISRSNKNFSAQIIDDKKGHSIVGMSTLSKEFEDLKAKGNIETAKMLGALLAKKAVSKGINKVVFDRNGLLYHGKVKAFAEAARENGLEF